MVQIRARTACISARVELLGPPQVSLALSAGDEAVSRELVLLASVRVTSGQGVEIRGEKGPGVCCSFGLLWAQRGPTVLSVLGERPCSCRQADSWVILIDPRPPSTEVVQDSWDHHPVQLRPLFEHLEFAPFCQLKTFLVPKHSIQGLLQIDLNFPL